MVSPRILSQTKVGDCLGLGCVLSTTNKRLPVSYPSHSKRKVFSFALLLVPPRKCNHISGKFYPQAPSCPLMGVSSLAPSKPPFPLLSDLFFKALVIWMEN